MPINKKSYIQEWFTNSVEWNLVSGIAQELFGYLSKLGVTSQMVELNVPGTSSKKIQDDCLKKL